MEEETVRNEDYLKLADPNYETNTGWVDMRGNFYPCDYGGHYGKLNDMLEGGFMRQVGERIRNEEAENSLVKFSGGNILSYAKQISARARLTIETIVEKHNMLVEGRVEQAGQYEFWVEDGKAKSRRI